MNYEYKPQFKFNLQSFLDVANCLVESEDTNLALEFMDRFLPSFYRDTIPRELTDLKNRILALKYTQADYSVNSGDDLKPIEHSKQAVEGLLRFKVLKEEIKKANDANIVPHLVDFGPGDYTLPIGLNSHLCLFTYNGIGLYDRAKIEAKQRLEHLWREVEPKDRPIWFVAYEVVEHLENEWEIRQAMNRLVKIPERIFISTPLYTYAEGNPNPETKKIPHLRTYTPSEFVLLCNKMFPEYNLHYITNEVQTIIGDLK